MRRTDRRSPTDAIVRRWAIRMIVATSCLVVDGDATAAAPALNVKATTGPTGNDIAVVADARGTVTAVWRDRSADGRARLNWSRHRRGGRWSDPAAIAVAAPQGELDLLRVVVSRSNGTVHALVDRRDVASQTTSLTDFRWRPENVPEAFEVVRRSAANAVIFPADDWLGRERGSAAIAPDDGDGATVLWCEQPVGADPGRASNLSGAQTLWAREGSAPPRVLWRGDGCEVPFIDEGPDRDLAAIWWIDPPEEGADSWGIARHHGVWSTPQRLTDDAQDPILIDGAGSLAAVLAPRQGRDLPAYRTDPLHATRVRHELIPLRPLRRFAPKLIGAGQIVRYDAVSAGAGQTLVGTLLGQATVTLGPTGTSLLTASTRTTAGRWSVRAIDRWNTASSPFMAGTDWPQPRLPVVSRDERGRIVATWNEVGSDQPCRVLTLQSVHHANGAWSRRRVLLDHREGGECDEGSSVWGISSVGRFWWTRRGGRLIVNPLPSTKAPAPRPRLRLVTRTWDAIRRRGAIEFACTAASAGDCRVSLVDPARHADAVDDLGLACRPLIAGAHVVSAGATVLVRFPLTHDCYAGGSASAMPDHARAFRVTATFDRAGSRTSGASERVEVTP